MADKNQLFSNMHSAALIRLSDCTPEDICRRGNVSFSKNEFRITSLGQNITITYPDYKFHPELPHWQTLTILHYLSSADGTPLSGNLISFSQHKDGLIRGSKFDRNAERIMETKLGMVSLEELSHRIQRLGGELLRGNADLFARFSYLPNYPVYLKLWLSDDEFPTSGRMFLDASAEHYLSIEDAVTIGELILEKLCDPNAVQA